MGNRGCAYRGVQLGMEKRKRYVKDPSTDIPFIFDIGQHTLEFGKWDFCLVADFRFGKVCLDHLSKGRSGFRDRVFPGVARVKGIELNKLLHSQTDFNNLLDDDVVRVCLLLALDFVFMGFELRHVISNQMLNLVNDFSAWDDFHWGHYIWEEFHKKGFVFALKIWLLETFPTSKTWWFKEQNVIPRLSTLTPSSDEMNKPWWKSSLKYFHNVSNASTSSHAPSNKKKSRFKRKVVSREVHVCIEVSREVHVRTDVSREVHVHTDVHHYVDEGLSVQDLVKKIGDMQREFQSRITAVEQYVNQHKTSSTANDSPVDNVFSDTKDFDHDSFSSFTENPDDRAALMNKITDMRTSFESDVDTKNVNNDSMDVDDDPKVLEQQNISGKNLFDEFEQQVSSNNLINHEALEEPNVAGNNLFQEEDQQFSSKNLDVQQEALEMDVQLEMEERFAVDNLCSMIDFDIPKEQIEPMIPKATVQGCKNLATAQSIITEYESQHAIHDQLDTLSMKNVDSVQMSNDAQVDTNPTIAVNSLRVPLERDHKVSRYLQDPYIIQPDSTKLNNKVCVRHKKNKKLFMPLPLTTPHGELIPAWTETEVLEKKNIDPANYSITYRYAVNVPRQGDAYGDCGIWVMRNMYRLVNNLSLDVSNPTQLGLAYRERLTDFFWKYKIPAKQ
ncbi:phospholipase-like protein [Tanacetum coccineum]|uniref:Phospholipase-like protein n=1 Tax=Tanacetum coccineum TaxID=301880 RepID=A0ABQ5D8G1_9ASTR